MTRLAIELEVEGGRVVRSRVQAASEPPPAELPPTIQVTPAAVDGGALALASRLVGTPKRRRRKKKPPLAADAPNSIRYKSGSRGDPWERSDGELMVKVTFAGTRRFDVVLKAFVGTLLEERNTWMEEALLDAIRERRGQKFIDNALKVAEQELKRRVG